jgi:hypothetical protein
MAGRFKRRLLRIRPAPVRLLDRRACRLGKGFGDPGDEVRDSYTARGILHAGARQRSVAVIGGCQEPVGAGQVDPVSLWSAPRELELTCWCARFAIANVSDDVVRGVPERLQMLNDIMQQEHQCRIEE